MFPATTCAHVVVRVFVVVTFFTVVVLHVVAASITPEVHIAVATTSSGGSGHTKLTGNLSPSIQWNTEGSVAGCSYEGGAHLTANDLSMVDMPFSVWGKLRRTIQSWDISAKMDAQSQNLAHLNIDLQARGGPSDLLFRAKGIVNTQRPMIEPSEVGLAQSFNVVGGDLLLYPRFHILSRKPDVTIAYEHGNTRVQLEADMDQQKLTLAQRVNEDNVIVPAINSEGNMSLEYQRRIRDNEAVVTARFAPNDSASLRYEEGPWVATADWPVAGLTQFGAARFNIRRSISMEVL